MAQTAKSTAVIGKRKLKLLGFRKKGDERYVVGDTVMERAKELGVRSGEELGHHLLANQRCIPVEWRDYDIILPNWRRPGHPRDVAYLCFTGFHWSLHWRYLDHGFGGRDRLIALARGGATNPFAPSCFVSCYHQVSSAFICVIICAILLLQYRSG